MNIEQTADQTIVIDGRQGYDLGLAEGALRLLQFDRTTRILPLRRIGHVILRNPRSSAIRALLELAGRGIPIHFLDGAGRIGASLIATQPDASPEVTEWIHCVQRINFKPRYIEWLALQLRHGISRILRRGTPGSAEVFERKLLGYAKRGMDATFDATWNEIRALNWAWVDGEITRQHLRGLADALSVRDCTLVHDLDRILSIPLLWELTPWLRTHRFHHPMERMAFFAQQRRMIETRFALALSALRYHLGGQEYRPAATLTRRSHRSAH